MATTRTNHAWAFDNGPWQHRCVVHFIYHDIFLTTALSLLIDLRRSRGSPSVVRASSPASQVELFSLLRLHYIPTLRCFQRVLSQPLCCISAVMYQSKYVQHGSPNSPSPPLDTPTQSASLELTKPDGPARPLITTVLANNIHCASCVAYIREVLYNLGPSIRNVEISILSHEIRIRHDEDLPATIICQSLNDAAFELYDATTTDTTGAKVSQIDFGEASDGWLEQAVGLWRRSHQSRPSSSSRLAFQEKARRHMQNCEACRELAVFGQKYTPRSYSANLGGEKKALPVHTSEEETDRGAKRLQQRDSTTHDGIPPLSEKDTRSTPTSRDLTAKARHQPDTSERPFVVIHKAEETASSPRAHEAVDEYSLLLSVGGMTCAACSGGITHSLEEVDFIKSVNVTLLTNSATVSFTGPKANADLIVERITDLGYDAAIEKCSQIKAPPVHQRSSPHAQKMQAILSIGGMTCGACTGTVRRGLEELQYIESIAIDLLSNSGTVIFTGKQHLDEIVEKIEDLGYDCTVQECNPVTADGGGAQADQGRSVKLAITGMFCEHCPLKIAEAIETTFSGQVQVEKSPTLKDPIIEVTYTPRPPQFTIRQIIATIRGVNDDYQVSVYHPPTLEQRSRAMQLHERRRLLFRHLISLIFAIPTLLIGVVWMSIVPSTNTTRMYLETPIWAGNVTRSDWALFILATPVYLLAADVFHRRAIKEIRALWRRGSKVPILRRFYRFGSMNLLISAGTSVAYFASLAMLIINATSKTASSGNGTTYFDSVIFLTFFILIGRFLEAYSKAKTGDAVASLGKLRPSQALLVKPGIFTEDSSDSSQEKLDLPSSDASPEKVDVDLLETDDDVLIPHGVSPPADGLVVIGSSQFDESSLTGESRPITKNVGDSVFAGSLNTGKPVTIKITGANGASMLDQIVSVVREGQTRRAPVERLADILTGFFVPVITLLAIITFVLWFSLGQSGALPRHYLDTNQGGWAFWSLEFAIAVFVVACNFCLWIDF